MTYWGHTSKGQSQVLTTAAVCQLSFPSVLDREHRNLRHPGWPFPYYGDLLSTAPRKSSSPPVPVVSHTLLPCCV